jgi:hypothetical protein
MHDMHNFFKARAAEGSTSVAPVWQRRFSSDGIDGADPILNIFLCRYGALASHKNTMPNLQIC